MKKTRLGDIAIITMGQSPESCFYNTEGRGMPFLQGSKTFGRIFPTFSFFTERTTKTALKGDVLMSVRAPVGDINIAPTDMCIGRGLCSIRMKNGNQKYLFYLLKNNIHNILSKQNGTVFASVNRKDLESLELYVLNEEEQKSFGHFLALFDEKINLNDEINDNLSNTYSWKLDTSISPEINLGKRESRRISKWHISSWTERMSSSIGRTNCSNCSILSSDGIKTGMVIKESRFMEPKIVPSPLKVLSLDLSEISVYRTNELCPSLLWIAANPRPMQHRSYATFKSPTGARTLRRTSPGSAKRFGSVVYKRRFGKRKPNSALP